MISHDQPTSPRGQRSPQATPLPHQEERLNHDQGLSHSQIREVESPLHRLGGRGEKGPEDPCRLELTVFTPPSERKSLKSSLPLPLRLLSLRNTIPSPRLLIRTTGRPRGFAFVTMSSPEEAQKAIAALNGKNWAGVLSTS